MKIKRALPLLWLPLIAFWSFLFALRSGITSTNLENIVPIITYFLVSFLLILQLQLVLGNKKESGIVKFGTANVISICLSISSVAIFLNLLNSVDNQLSLFLIITPLIINTIIAEVFSVSNKEIIKKKDAWVRTNEELEKEQNKASLESASERNLSMQTRKEWKKYLQGNEINCTNPEIQGEIGRIKNIVDYSSYFRSPESKETLEKIKKSSDENLIINLLKEIK